MAALSVQSASGDERCVGQRRPELRVRGHTADDRDTVDAGALRPPRAAAG